MRSDGAQCYAEQEWFENGFWSWLLCKLDLMPKNS